MKSSAYQSKLAEITLNDVIKWVHSYNGEQRFVLSCKRKMSDNIPIDSKSLGALKKCCAYFTVYKPKEKTEKQMDALNQEVNKFLYEE